MSDVMRRDASEVARAVVRSPSKDEDPGAANAVIASPKPEVARDGRRSIA